MLGGAKLALLGGSLYFVIAGVALVAAGVQIVRGRPNGALIFGATFALTILWALWEVGLSSWPLVSRLLAMGAGATVVAVSYLLLRAARGRTPAWRPALVTAAVIGLASAPLPQTIAGATPITAVTGPEGAACQRRILMNTINAVLMAFDADTGKVCADFAPTAVSTSRPGSATCPIRNTS